MTSTAAAVRPMQAAAISERGLVALFGMTVFTAAVALFLVQPMIAKGLLPLFGGTPAVWTTSMLFFQAALLGGYGLAHLTLTRLGPRRQSRVQLVLVVAALAAMPLAGPSASPTGDPIASILVLLGTGVGLPFLALSTASPVLQRWFSVSGHSRASNPYVLYIASNLGSLVALLAYPFVVEPHLSLDAQRVAWAGLYVVFIGLLAACAVALFPIGRRQRGAVPSDAPEAASAGYADDAVAPTRASWFERARWLVLAFIPSSLMLGVTTYLTTDIASAPLLWVAPLSLYLASFVVAFSRFADRATRIAAWILPFLAIATAIDTFGSVGLPVALRLLLHLSLFTVAAILCHGRLAASRPQPARLTEFYFLLAIGGVMGGIVNAIVAPQLLDVVAEYPLAIGASLLAREGTKASARRRWVLGAGAFTAFVALAAVPVMLGVPGAWSLPALVILMSLPLLIAASPLPFGMTVTALLLAGMALSPPPLLAQRNFFGLFQVQQAAGEHVLVHGTTIHGTQAWPPDARPTGAGYYHPEGPLGDVMRLSALTDAQEIGVIGLGSGGMTAFLQAGQHVTFYEIDPAVAEVAADDRYFTYLSSTAADVDVLIGDGRLLVQEEPPASLDVLIVDAFSSDAVPVHLLTREAFALYVDRLRESGLLVLHVSNRYVDLAPIVSAAARELGLVASMRHDPGLVSDDVRVKRQPSRYIVLARDEARIAPLADSDWRPLPATDRRPWTDDFSEIVSLIDWGGQVLR